MKKHGFTLAEVLITLTIIGVIAALTMPSLFTSTADAKIGPALAKFTNTMNVGLEKTMIENDLSTFTASADDLDLLAKSVRMDKLEGGGVVKVNENNLTKTSTWVMQDGTKFYVLRWGTPGENPKVGNYQGIVADILIDIDGDKGSSKAGSDIFGFVLDGSGVLIPGGSAAHHRIGQYLPSLGYAQDEVKGADGKVTSAKIEENCVRNSTIGAGLACTGAIANNGWAASKDLFKKTTKIPTKTN